MHAASRHGTHSLTSHPKDGGVSCLVVHLEVAHPVSDRTQPCLTSFKLMELTGPLGHSPRKAPDPYRLSFYIIAAYVTSKYLALLSIHLALQRRVYLTGKTRSLFTFAAILAIP